MKKAHQTKTDTIIAMLTELIEEHMEVCENEFPADSSDRVKHVISEQHETQADITELRTAHPAIDHMIFMDLDDGAQFTITVSKVA